jgi:hypothetical protein
MPRSTRRWLSAERFTIRFNIQEFADVPAILNVQNTDGKIRREQSNSENEPALPQSWFAEDRNVAVHYFVLYLLGWELSDVQPSLWVCKRIDRAIVASGARDILRMGRVIPGYRLLRL